MSDQLTLDNWRDAKRAPATKHQYRGPMYWSEDDDATLFRLFAAGLSIRAIGRAMGRTWGSVRNRCSRLRKRGLMPRRKAATR